MQRQQIPLSDLAAGTHAFVLHIFGGRGFVNRLLVLGFTIGSEVVVVQNYGHGPVIVSVRDARIALGRGEAKKVIVELSSRG